MSSRIVPISRVSVAANEHRRQLSVEQLPRLLEVGELEHPAPTADRADAVGAERSAEHDEDRVAAAFALLGEPGPAGELEATR